jgi:hypothetical protein
MNTLVLDGQEEIQYRFNPGRSIERTEDGGQFWEVEFTLSHHIEAQSATYLIKHSEFNPWILGGPIEAIAYAGSGNIIVSMGLEGVLVRTRGEGWVPVGLYERIEPQSSQVYKAVLTDEFIIGAILVILLLGTAIRHVERRIPKELLFTAVVWLMWVWLIQSVKEDTYSAPFIDLDWLFIDLGLLSLTAILSLILLICRSKVDFYKRSPRAFLAVVLSSFVGGILFLVPYILWIQNNLPR